MVVKVGRKLGFEFCLKIYQVLENSSLYCHLQDCGRFYCHLLFFTSSLVLVPSLRFFFIIGFFVEIPRGFGFIQYVDPSDAAEETSHGRLSSSWS